MRPLAVDLFSGLGGWTEGLVAAGWHVIRFDLEDMCKLLSEPYPEHSSLVIQNVLTLHGSQFKNVGLIVSSSPCTEYSWMAMPWSRAKQVARALRGEDEFPENYRGSRSIEELNALFNAQFRIQREASEAAGRHIPMVCENVRGAAPWVGRSRASFGSYHLYGDVPALMPMTARGVKVPGMGAGWVHPDDPRHKPGLAFNPAAQGARVREERAAATKNDGGSWFAIGSPGQKVTGQNPDGRKLPGFRFDGSGGSFQTASVEAHTAEGRKHHGDWFRDPACPSRQGGQVRTRDPVASCSSNSPRRKAASARIAKIPLSLAIWIGRAWLPREVAT